MGISKSIFLSASLLAVVGSLAASQAVNAATTQTNSANKPVTAQATSARTTDRKGVVMVAANATVLYDSPNAQQSELRTLLPGSEWKFFKIVTNDRGTWYSLGGNQWVNGAQVNEINANNNSSTVTRVSNDLKGITLVTRRTAVWRAPGAGRTSRYLPAGTSWRFFKVATTKDGKNWYNLGGNQWVVSKDMDYGQDPHFGHVAPSYNRKSVATVQRGGARVYHGDAGPYDVATKRVLPAGSRWKVFNSKNYGVPMYNLGGNQWVKAFDVSVR